MSSRGNTATSTFIKQEASLAIKAEPGIIKPERLSSFRLPRDLTLGGITPARHNRNVVNKKVYTPNLNATRNKNSDVKTSRDTTAIGRGRGRGERGRGTGAARGARGAGKNSALVQTSGLFSEGSGEQRLRKSSVFDRNSSGGDGIANSLRRPTIVKREIKIDPEVERKHIQEVLGDDNDDDMMSCSNGYANGDFSPISVHEIKSEIKTEMKNENSDQTAKQPASNYPQSLEDFFSRQHPQLFLLQLPDSLPGHGPEDEIGESAAAEQAASNSDDPSSKYCTVRQLEEGLIGTIVRYKSGRTKLVTGDTRFDLNLGMEPGLLQEVISVNSNAKERSGNLINLGQVNAKLSAIPDWEYIFAKSSS